MKENTTSRPVDLPYNKSVKEAYNLILKKAKQLLSTMEREELRYVLVRECTFPYQCGTVVHELVNPLIYLRLDCGQHDLLQIHYGFEEVDGNTQYSAITAMFVRNIYQFTSKEQTKVDIEQSVKTGWLIRTCSELFEYIEDRDKHHIFMQIPYKPAAVKRKRLLSVA